MVRRSLRVAVLGVSVSCASSVLANPAMQVGFLWHMHQPTYYPGESIVQTQNANRYSYSVYDIHNQRFGPYTSWPKDAINAASGLPNAGASVSFSGSLIENLNAMQGANVNGGMWNNWQSSYTQARSQTTVEGNSRLDFIGFTYEHGLGPLLDTRDLRMQLKMHKTTIQANFGSAAAYSKGFFPAETAFSERMIPALVAEGFDWAIVDNIHMDRATKNYPQTNSSGLFAPNRADQINPDPTTSGGAWVQLNNVWAPSKVSAPFSYRPHNVQYVDPNSGTAQKLVAVPGARYEGNEDGRGGFGALQYQSVMDQYKQYNTDPNHPMLVVLHHDGDNYGGGSDGYYHNNWNNMVNWASGNPNYNVTTIADYLKKYPVAASDLIHVENGSWAGADNGDPEFKKWLGDPNGSGWSPDQNSWAVLTAAKNRVYTAEDLTAPANPQNVINNTGSAAERAWHYLVQAQASDHWYWDGTEIWDSNVTRGSNLAVAQANTVLTPTALANETTAPSVFIPQRNAYNPGGYEWGTTTEPSDFEVWTFAYDVSGLTSVTLKFRTDVDGENPLASTQNETYAGGSEVSQWTSLSMTSSTLSNPANILNPTVRANRFGGMITGLNNKLVDYYVEAVDAKGNVARTDIQHVYVGNSTVVTPPPTGGFTMDGILDGAAIERASNNGMKLSWAIDGNKLYLATNDAGEGSDHFIYIAKTVGAMRAANWAKAGQVAGWDAFLADENDNNYSAWFDAPTAANAQSATGTNGGVLEGVLDLAGMYGSLPEVIYVAVGLYATADGGALLSTHQVPTSVNGDGNLDSTEYIAIRLVDYPQWLLAGDGNWNAGANWTFGKAPNASGARATFGATTTARSIALNDNVTVGRLRFNGAGGYTVNGTGAIALSGGERMIESLNGINAVNVPISLDGATTINVMSTTQLSLGSVNAGTQAITRTGVGWLKIGSLTAGAVSLEGGRTSLTSTTIASKVKSLSFVFGTELELGNALLAIDHDGALDVATVRGWITTGKLIATTDADTAIGVVDNAILGATSFGGQSVDATSILLRKVTRGDTNLDGTVNFDDLLALAQHYGATAGKGWVQGDSNYDGAVNFDDLLTLAQHYAGGALAGGTLSGGAVAADWELARSLVPEPMALLGGVALLRGRRRPAGT